jgi:hypothetical protein
MPIIRTYTTARNLVKIVFLSVFPAADFDATLHELLELSEPWIKDFIWPNGLAIIVIIACPTQYIPHYQQELMAMYRLFSVHFRRRDPIKLTTSLLFRQSKMSSFHDIMGRIKGNTTQRCFTVKCLRLQGIVSANTGRFRCKRNSTLF